jgi:hypothetical protein
VRFPFEQVFTSFGGQLPKAEWASGTTTDNRCPSWVYIGSYGESEDTCQFFVEMWAVGVTRQVARVRQTREKADFDWRAAERMEDWSPSELDIAQDFRTQWAEEHTFVWAVYQLERWVCRLAEERGRETPPRDQVLANVRNALEHLDEVEFEGDDTVPE